MSVFDINGNQVTSLYDANGDSLSQAYDINGTSVFQNNKLTVMTFNVQRWSGINANAIIMNSIFSAYTPVVCGVQETGQDGTLNYIPGKFQSGKAMECAVPNKTALLFNTSYSNYSDALFSNQSAGEKRGYQKCYVTIGSKSVAVFNTHLEPYVSSVRIAQAMELLTLMSQETYSIAVGDFNFQATTLEDSEYVNIAEPFIEAGYNMANWTQETGLVNTWFDGTTVEGSTEKYPTDNIIVSSNITIDQITYDQRKITAGTGLVIDHIPVVAVLAIH